MTVTQAECADTQTLWVNVAAALGDVEHLDVGGERRVPDVHGVGRRASPTRVVAR